MTTLNVNIPEELAQRAQSLGLLTDAAIQKLLEEAIRRAAGKRLLELSTQLEAADIVPMSEEEVVAEVKAVRAARHNLKNSG